MELPINTIVILVVLLVLVVLILVSRGGNNFVDIGDNKIDTASGQGFDERVHEKGDCVKKIYRLCFF